MATSIPESSSKKLDSRAPVGRPTATILRRLMRERKGAVGTVCMLLFILVAIVGPRVAPYNPIELHLDAQLAPPSARFWWGADELGRDILSRVIHGARASLAAGVLAVGLAGVVGVATGLVSGYLGGWIDAVISRIWDTLLAFPAIFLAIGIVTIIGRGYLNAVLAVAIINLPTFARLVRASTIALKGKDFVEAARAIGAPNARIMFRTIFPNCLSLVVVQMAIAAPAAILVEASLSYLGLGSQPPTASWGNMLTAAQSYLYRSPTYGIFPGATLTLVVIALNYFADGLQDAIDPRRTRAGAQMT